MKHEVKREKLKVQMIILAALAAVFIVMLPSSVVAFYHEAIPNDVAPAGLLLFDAFDADLSIEAGCFFEYGVKNFKICDPNYRVGGCAYVSVGIGETDDVSCAMN